MFGLATPHLLHERIHDSRTLSFPSFLQAKVKLLHTGGDSHDAKEARAELKAWVPSAILPRSLGGGAFYGADGDCCVGVAHASFLRVGDDGLSAGVAALEAFIGVAPHEIAAVGRLQQESS